MNKWSGLTFNGKIITKDGTFSIRTGSYRLFFRKIKDFFTPTIKALKNFFKIKLLIKLRGYFKFLMHNVIKTYIIIYLFETLKRHLLTSFYFKKFQSFLSRAKLGPDGVINTSDVVILLRLTLTPPFMKCLEGKMVIWRHNLHDDNASLAITISPFPPSLNKPPPSPPFLSPTQNFHFD